MELIKSSIFSPIFIKKTETTFTETDSSSDEALSSDEEIMTDTTLVKKQYKINK